MSSVKDFTDFLIAQQPVYDEAILKTMYGTDVVPLPIDRRLLPNHLRTILRLREDKRWSFKRIARKLRITHQKASAQYRKGTTLLYSKFDSWLSNQPKYRQVHERKIRTKPIIDPWVALVKKDRYPDLTASWPPFNR